MCLFDRHDSVSVAASVYILLDRRMYRHAYALESTTHLLEGQFYSLGCIPPPPIPVIRPLALLDESAMF